MFRILGQEKKPRYHLPIFAALVISICCTMGSTTHYGDKIGLNVGRRAKFKYEMDVKKDVFQRIGGEENWTNVNFTYKTAFFYEIDTELNYEFYVTIEFLYYQSKNGTTASIAFEDDDSESKSHIGSSNALRQARFQLKIKSDGSIADMMGYEEYLQKCSSGNERALGKEFIKSVAQEVTRVVPVGGGKISYRAPDDSDRIKYLTNHCFVDEDRNGVVNVKCESAVEKNLQSGELALLMTGNEQSTIQLEENTGLLLRTNRMLSLQGSSQIGQTEIFQKVTKITSIIGDRVSDETR